MIVADPRMYGYTLCHNRLLVCTGQAKHGLSHALARLSYNLSILLLDSEVALAVVMVVI